MSGIVRYVSSLNGFTLLLDNPGFVYTYSLSILKVFERAWLVMPG